MSQLGRISGPLLKANLLRDGKDIAFETNLLYFNVNTHTDDIDLHPLDPSLWSGKIGIKTDTPQYDLDIVGTTQTTHLITDELDVGELNIVNNPLSPNDTLISNVLGNITIQAKDSTGIIEIKNSVLPSINETYNLGSPTRRWNNIYAKDLNLSGNVTIGDSNTDSIAIFADITSNLIPNASSLYTVGSPSNTWKEMHTDAIFIGGTQIGGSGSGGLNLGHYVIYDNIIEITVTDEDAIIRANGIGKISLASSTEVSGDFSADYITDTILDCGDY